MNTPIDFKSAIVLKEIGYEVKCTRFVDLISNVEINDAPLGNYNLSKQSVSIPTIVDVVMWLSEYRQIDISHIVNWSFDLRTYRIGIIYLEDNKIKSVFLRPEHDSNRFIEFNSVTEAYKEGIKFILEKILK